MHKGEILMKLNMSFFIKDDELIENVNEIWEKVKNILKKEFDSEPVYDKKCIKAKIKNPLMEKSKEISATTKYQRKVLNVFAYQ